MINFFRKIRRKFAYNNQFLKYSRYAIGEIALIMIGILLALQLNNWNEEKKVLKFEQEVLRDLKIEMVSNIKGLDETTSSNRRSLKYAKLLNEFYVNPELLNQYSGDSIFKMTWRLAGEVFVLDNGILNSIISSGQIKSIKNKELRYKLSSLNQVTEKSLSLSKRVEIDGSEYFDFMIFPKAGTVIENGRTNWNYGKDIFKIPETHIAIRGIYIERRLVSLVFEEELKLFYEEILTLINREIK